LLLVMVLAAAATWGGNRTRRTLGSRRFILAGGIAFPVVVLTALLFHTFGVARALVQPLPEGGSPLRIEVVGHQFWWEVRYPAAPPAETIVTANEIRIPIGRDVELRVTSADVIHSLWVPALQGKIDMIPGQVNFLRLRADRPAVVRGQCAEFCGAQHALMAFLVVAEPPEAFEAWLQRQRLPAPMPTDPVLATGRHVFGAAGCGGCHTVRGTEWAGQAGPDLTTVGGRLSLGAGILANHRGTIAGWIAGSQDLKRGNRMPSFASALDGPELRAVAIWLESLK
jgi:cytochrome c oxidase subunit 2